VAARCRGAAVAEAGAGEGARSRRRRARAPRPGAQELAAARHRGGHAAGAFGVVGALHGFQGAAAQAAAGLVPPGGGERHRLARRLLLPAALVRVGVAAAPTKKARTRGLFLFRQGAGYVSFVSATSASFPCRSRACAPWGRTS